MQVGVLLNIPSYPKRWIWRRVCAFGSRASSLHHGRPMRQDGRLIGLYGSW